MMNIMRNEPARLARLNDPLVQNEKFVQRIRPLMHTPEKEVAIYAMLKGIKIERIECPHAHTAFRQHIRAMLNETEEKYPGTKFKIVNCFLDMENALHDEFSKGAKLKFCTNCGEPTGKSSECMFCKMTRKSR
jgi:uncharacterized protein (TIGR00269 family)